MKQTSLRYQEAKGDVSLGQRRPKKTKSPKRRIFDWGLTILIAFCVALILRVFVFQTYTIPSGSMEPTLQIGDRILVNKLAYRLHGISRFDLIVFHAPKDAGQIAPGTVLVKRIIGLPGETIYSTLKGEIYVDGKELNEPFLSETSRLNPGPQIPKQVIPRGYYFVMGDNRADSYDSRYLGPIRKSLIIGKVDAVIWRNGFFAFKLF